MRVIEAPIGTTLLTRQFGMRTLHITPIYIPEGCTGYVQPLYTVPQMAYLSKPQDIPIWEIVETDEGYKRRIFACI